VALLPLEDEAAEALVAPLPEQERFASWHLVRAGGRISSRGAAAIDLLRALGYARPARAAARVEGAIERLYGLVAEHRDKLGRFVPDGPAPRRFP
jgi:predicted DCC family thiol-disulfide oxidoreductase YuxK